MYDVLGEVPAQGELLALYDSVGWTAYTRDPDRLIRAVAGADDVITARLDGVLVGMARVLTDGEAVAYLQDVLVAPDHQRRGVGRLLLEAVKARHDVRQLVLLTDDEPGQHDYYRALGLTRADEMPHGPLRAFVLYR